MLENKITFDRFIRIVFSLAIFVGILMLLDRLSGVLLPFFVAWLIAYLIYPLVKFFQYKLRMKYRILAIFCALVSITVILGAAFYFLVPPIIDEFGKVKDLLFSYFTSNTHSAENVPQSLIEFIKENVDFNALNEMMSQERIMNAIRATVPKLWNLLSESINLLFSILASFIILLYIVFILLDYESISEGWIHYLPKKYQRFIKGLVSDVQVGMNRYFRGQALVALCVGILFSIGFLIIDFPLAIALGLFIGALNIVPYLQIIGFIPTILLAILKAADTGQNFWVIIIAAAAVFIIVQIIQDGYLVPRIMGKITGLNPAVILLSLSIWGSLLGILGLIIALPLTTLMLSYYERFIVRGEKISEERIKRPDIQKKTKKQEK